MVKAPQFMPKKLPTGLKLLLDFAPLGGFFIAYKLLGLQEATMAIIALTILCTGIIYAVERQLALAPIITGVVVTVMGGLGLWLKNDQFIKMKPTLINLLFAGILLVGVYIYKKGVLSHVLGMAVEMTEQGWLLLSRRWGFFFLFLAVLNECIWRNFPTDFWVDFKVFGMFSLTILFALCQIPLMGKYQKPAN